MSNLRLRSSKEKLYKHSFSSRDKFEAPDCREGLQPAQIGLILYVGFISKKQWSKRLSSSQSCEAAIASVCFTGNGLSRTCYSKLSLFPKLWEIIAATFRFGQFWFTRRLLRPTIFSRSLIWGFLNLTPQAAVVFPFASWPLTAWVIPTGKTLTSTSESFSCVRPSTYDD